jgi:hypothetical protein
MTRERPAVDLSGRLGLSMAEAAAALGVSERLLRAHRHELPIAKIGEKLVVPVDALRDWLRQSAKQGPSKTDAAVEKILRSIE